MLSLLLKNNFSTQVRQREIKKLLIANRGEIAMRVIKTCKKLGIKTVGVYTDADSRSLHVRSCDEAYYIGASPAKQSYLVMDKIVDVIKKSGAQAVHPGYGFLSENATFSDLVENMGVAFLGPTGYSIDAMGDKIHSKTLATNAGVSVIPGYLNTIETADEAVKIANQIGYPVMVKASGGGGGKGMRICYTDDETREGYRLSRAEAKSSFNDDRMFIEKYIEEPHHIEIQLLADEHGNIVAFPERECSIQRRNQKVIEEAPSCLITPQTRAAMQKQAAMLAKAVKYRSAGTIECLVDKHQNFYFLEMNTRLQVEHPITESITGVDLVEQMIRIGEGKTISPELLEFFFKKFKKKNRKSVNGVPFQGNSIEVRLYAEDPLRGYLPSIGPLIKYREPKSTATLRGRPQVRCDSGIYEGGEISMYYDPMICKLVSYADSRNEAISIMNKSIDEYIIQGPNHNAALLRDVLNKEVFKGGNTPTSFLKTEYPKGFHGSTLYKPKEFVASSALIHFLRGQNKLIDFSPCSGDQKCSNEFIVRLDKNELVYKTKIEETSKGNYKIIVQQIKENRIATLNDKTRVVKSIDNNVYELNINNIDWILETILFKANINNSSYSIQYQERLVNRYKLQFEGVIEQVTVLTPKQFEYSKHQLPPLKIDASKYLLSPMAGTIISLNVKEGSSVEIGQEIAVVEAMKMQNLLRSVRKGVVKKINCTPGKSIALDGIVIEYEDDVKA